MIDLGGVVQLAVDVKDASGVPATPGAATLTLTLPDGTTVTPTVPTPAITGQLRVDYTTVQAGHHTWLMTTTAPATAYADVFDVEPAMPSGIVSLAAAKKQLNIPPTDTTDDDELRGYIAATTGAIDDALGRVTVRHTFEERVTASSAQQLLLSQVPVMSLTSVATVDGAQSWSVSPAVLDIDGDSGMVTVLSGPSLNGFLKVMYVAGMTVIPQRYRLGGMIVLQHLWETQRGTMGATMGGDQEAAYLMGRGFALPRRALELLGTSLPGIA